LLNYFEMNKTEKNILKTLIFFDLLKKPLTDKEIWQNLWGIKTSFKNLKKSLRSLQKQSKVENRDELYFLKGKNQLIKVGQKKHRICQVFWQKAQKTSQFLQIIPFIKIIAVIGSLSLNNVTQKSDIDLMIFTDKKHLRLTRDLVIFLLSISGKLTRQKQQKSGQIGPDFFITPETCNLEFLIKKYNGFQQMYWIYLVANLTPIFEKAQVYEKYKAQNKWIKKFLPNYNWQIQNKKIKPKKSHFKNFLKWFFITKMGQILEKKLAQKQKERLHKFQQKSGKDLIINSDEQIIQFSDLEKKWQKFEQKFEKFLTNHNLI